MFQPLEEIETYSKDGRSSLYSLYTSYLRLKEEFKWELKTIYSQSVVLKAQTKLTIPVISLQTPRKGQGIWLTSGIHGEEPAGPNAIARSIDFLGELSKNGFPIVLTPLCNPSGYYRNWRYQNEYRDWRKGKSVGDSEHLLPDLKNRNKPRAKKPSCRQADSLTKYILKEIVKGPPLLSIDLHEDEALKESYIYSHGRLGAKDKIAKEIILILKKSGIPLQLKGKTRFGEEIFDGIISDTMDGSIDELLSSKEIFVNGKPKKGPAVENVIVVETPTIGVTLRKRIEAHTNVIKSIEKFYSIASQFE